MMLTLFYYLLAAFGMGLLIFVHELGHYFVAKWLGMKIEAFSIGFGPAIKEWEKDGVRWKISPFLFGGYVKIAGLDPDTKPAEEGAAKAVASPWRRLAVILAGPFVNLLTAFLLFFAIWVAGGRDLPFAYLSNKIGFVDQRSPLYGKVEIGDTLLSIGGESYQGIEDLQVALLLADEKGLSLDLEGKNGRYQVELPRKDLAHGANLLSPAAPIILTNTKAMNPSFPLGGARLKDGERIVWMDNHFIYSQQELATLLAAPSVLLSIERNGQKLLVRAGTYSASDLKTTPTDKLDLEDLLFDASIYKGSIHRASFLAAMVSEQMKVERLLPSVKAPYFKEELEVGDKILAINGRRLTDRNELLRLVQERRAMVVIDSAIVPLGSYKEESELFFGKGFDFAALNELLSMVTEGSEGDNPLSQLEQGSLRMVGPLALIDQKQAMQGLSQGASLSRAEAEKKVLGIQLEQALARYNPNPFEMMGNAIEKMKLSLSALFTQNGAKGVAGPIGVLTLVQQAWSVGLYEAFYWLALISINLAILNLLPIPVLDGGMALFCLWEIITKRPVPAKAMQRILIPFVFLLVGVMLLATLSDIARIFGKS